MILRDKIAAGYSRSDVRDVSHLVREVRRHGVDAFSKISPCAGDALYVGLASEFAFGSYFARDNSVTSEANELS